MNSESESDTPRMELDTLKSIATETCKTLQQIQTEANGCISAVSELIQKIKTQQLSNDNEKGLSFMEMKNHTILSYLLSLSGLLEEKVGGNSIEGSPFIEQLVESRTVLEKIRPIEIKLKYKMDKLLRAAFQDKIEADPLRHRANPDNMSTDRNAEQDEEYESSVDSVASETEDPEIKIARKNTKTIADGIYRPPRVTPQHFDNKSSTHSKDDKSKRKAFSGTIIRELQEEFLDTPVEIHNMGDAYAKRLSRETREKESYEEAYMTRLPVTKADKHKEKSFSTLGVLGDELTNFSGKGTKRKTFTGKGKTRGRGSKKKFRK